MGRVITLSLAIIWVLAHIIAESVSIIHSYSFEGSPELGYRVRTIGARTFFFVLITFRTRVRRIKNIITMADVIDTMFGWFLEILEWLFKAFLKVCGWILKLFWIGIKALFGLIVGLFRKDNGDSAGQAPVSTESSSVSSPEFPSESAPAMRSYDDLLNDIAAIDNSSDAEQSAQDRLMNIELTGLLHNSLTYSQKARLLKLGEEKLAEITKDPIERGSFFGNMVSSAYALINHMTDNAVQDHAEKYKAGLDPNNQEVELEPLGNYIIDIMNIVAAMYSPDGKASFRIEMLEGIDLPTWTGDLQ